MVVALAVAAAAHPMGESAAGQTSVLVVYPDHVEVDYLIDVPNTFVATARPGSDAALAAMTTELASGLLLTVDGRAVWMRLRGPSPPPKPSSEHTIGFAVHLSALLPDGARDIELQTANLQEASNFYTGDVRIHPSLRVVSSSLLGILDGRIVRDDTLRWSRGDEHRRLTVTLADRAPAWWGWVAPPGDEVVRVRKALVPGPRDWLRPPTLTPGLWLAAVGAAFVAGFGGGRDWRAVPFAALGIALAGLPGAGSGRVELVAGVVALALTAGARFRPALGAFAIAAAVAGLAGTTHAAPAAAGVVGAFVLGSVLGARKTLEVCALGIAGVVLVRGVAGLVGGFD